MQLNTYLRFDGDCREAFAFYEQCFGGHLEAMLTFSDQPHCDDVKAADADRIMHAQLRVGDDVLMGTDAPFAYPYEGVKGSYVVVQIDDPAEAERIYATLAEGGQPEMPLQETFWARRFGMAIDRFGVRWMVNCEADGDPAGDGG